MPTKKQQNKGTFSNPFVIIAIITAIVAGLILYERSNLYGGNGNTTSVTTSMSTTMSSTTIIQLPNQIPNGDFSQGFNYWGGLRGWNVPPYGWATLDYVNYHGSAPSLRMEPDPYSVGGSSGDAGLGNISVASARW